MIKRKLDSVEDMDQKNQIVTSHESFSNTRLVIAVSFCVCGCFGIFGNSLAIAFYRKTTTTSTIALIRGLALSDLFVNILLFVDCLQFLWASTNIPGIVCKVEKWLVIWAATSSGLFVWMISTDRHKRICKPFEKQISVSNMKRRRLGIVVFASIISSRVFGTYDCIPMKISEGMNNSTTIYNYCTTVQDGEFASLAFINIIIDFGLVLTGWIYVTITYIDIVWTLFALRQKSKSRSLVLSQPPSRAKIDGTQSCNISLENIANESTTSIKDTSPKSVVFTVDTTSTDEEANNETRKRTNRSIDNLSISTSARRNGSSGREKRLTLMMLTVSFLFVVFFIPYFVVKIYCRLIQGSGPGMELQLEMQIFLKLWSLNSVSNPWIYFIFNPEYRQFVKSTLFCRQSFKARVS